MDKQTIEFLKESNKIEREYSKEALADSVQAWTMACLNSKDRYSIDYILGIHRRVMKRLNPRIAGKIRNVPVRIGGEIRNQSKKEIKMLLEIWLEHSFTSKTKDGIKDAHIQFEKIHPFEDGNGRVGRILMNIQRLANKLPLLIIYEGKEQMEYYKWFHN